MVAGVFAARFGGKQSVLLGLVLVTLGFIGLSQASDYRVLLALMVMLGMGTAFGYTPLISLLANTYPKRRGSVIGFTNSGVSCLAELRRRRRPGDHPGAAVSAQPGATHGRQHRRRHRCRRPRRADLP